MVRRLYSLTSKISNEIWHFLKEISARMDMFPDLVNPVWAEIAHQYFPREGICMGHTFYLTPEKSFHLSMRVKEGDCIEKDESQHIPPTIRDVCLSKYISSDDFWCRREVVLEDYPELVFVIRLDIYEGEWSFEAKRESIGYIWPEKKEFFRKVSSPTTIPEVSVFRNGLEFIYLSLREVPFCHDNKSFELMRKTSYAAWEGGLSPDQLKKVIRNSELGKMLSLDDFLYP